MRSSGFNINVHFSGDGMSKTHYRKVYKSDHLGQADLEEYMEEGRQLVFTIREVKQQQNVMVAGRKGNHNIAYFADNGVKPWVVNAGNAKVLKGFANSAFVEDWGGLVIQLYIDPSVRMKGETVGGVRVMPQQPKTVKPDLMPNTTQWNNAVTAYKRDGNLHKVLSRVNISPKNQALIIEQSK